MVLRIDDFRGDWRISRRISDHLTGHDLRFEGAAILTPVDGGLSYLESGTLTVPGQRPMQGERRYLWTFDGPSVSVCFDDGRFFHDFRLDGQSPQADHFCDPDEYHVDYAFADWPVWRAVWTVHGPRKNYRSETVYSRRAPVWLDSRPETLTPSRPASLCISAKGLQNCICRI